ncbi:unnamed protein product [Urochloa humidicola]
MDIRVSIPAVAPPMASTSDNKVAIVIPQRSPSNEILPLESQQHEPSSHPTSGFAKWVDLPLIKRLVAELLSMFVLFFTIAWVVLVADAEVHGGGGLNRVGVAAAAGLAMVVLILFLTHVSGAHMNPFVSATMLDLPPSRSMAYLAVYFAAMFLAGGATGLAAKALYGYQESYDPFATPMWAGDAEAFLVEFAATFVLFIVVVKLATDNRAVEEMVAVGLAAAVTINSLALMKSTSASTVTGRTLGLALLLYLVATLLGAIAGCRAYHAVMTKYLN